MKTILAIIALCVVGCEGSIQLSEQEISQNQYRQIKQAYLIGTIDALRLIGKEPLIMTDLDSMRCDSLTKWAIEDARVILAQTFTAKQSEKH